MLTKQDAREAISLAIKYFMEDCRELSSGEIAEAMEGLRIAQAWIGIITEREQKEKPL